MDKASLSGHALAEMPKSPRSQPSPIRGNAVRVVEVLASHGVEAWLMTRGFIRPAAVQALTAHREKVRVTIALTTLDRTLQRTLEPLAAPPPLRLRQITQLRQLGIPVQVSLDPLTPGLTDTRDNLAAVLEALAGAGVGHVTAGYLFLRPGIRDNLVRDLEKYGWEELVLSAFQGGPVLSAQGIAPAQYLPKWRRQRGYASLMALAAGLGITVSVSVTSNPDFQTPRRPASSQHPRQRLLPEFTALSGQLHFA